METKIIDSKGFNYISQVLEANDMSDLPDNVFLNKITTGSGMTSCSLTGDIPYVICVPTKPLIHNKLQWCKDRGIDAIGVFSVNDGGASNEEIAEFKGVKIIVTWDSLKRLVSVLGSRVSEFKILIDEAHELIKAGNYRDGAIDDVLELYPLFKSFIFGTATPVEDKYQHPKLKHIQKVSIKWSNLRPVTVNYCMYEKDLYKAVAVQAIEHLNGNMGNNAHFFVNSVKSIATVIRLIKKGGYADADNIRIICADTDRNEQVLIESLGKGFKIETINSTGKKINFYTSTCFQGCDLSDVNGVSYVVSDGSKDHTKIDVLITLPQIIGRIRDTKYSNQINMMYTPNKYYSHVTEDEFEVFTKAQLQEAASYVEVYKVASSMVKSALLNDAKENPYLKVNDADILVNDTALYSEMQNYKTLHNVYYVPYSKDIKGNKVYDKRSIQSNTVKQNEIDYNYTKTPEITIEGLNKAKLGKKSDFSTLCQEYISSEGLASLNNRQTIALLEPIIEEAFTILGADRMRTLEYRKGAIQQALILEDKLSSLNWKIAKLLDLRVGQWISAEDAKSKLKDVYSTLEIDKVAKGSDISKYYNTNNKSKRIDGIKTVGFIILNVRYKIQ